MKITPDIRAKFAKVAEMFHEADIAGKLPDEIKGWDFKSGRVSLNTPTDIATVKHWFSAVIDLIVTGDNVCDSDLRNAMTLANAVYKALRKI